MYLPALVMVLMRPNQPDDDGMVRQTDVMEPLSSAVK